MSYKDISKQKQFDAEFGYLMSPIYASQQKTAHSLIQEYGKEKCIIRCYVMIDGYIDNINKLKYYDSEQITAWENSIKFWQEVRMICKIIISNSGS